MLLYITCLGVAVDWLSRNIYFTDSERDTIEVATMDGSVKKVLFDQDIYNPRAIVVDPVLGLAVELYCTRCITLYTCL